MAANLSACGPCRFQSLDHETRILGIHFPIHGFALDSPPNLYVFPGISDKNHHWFISSLRHPF